MPYFFLFLIFISPDLWSQQLECSTEITTVAELDECLRKNGKKPTKSYQEILQWKKRLNITAPLEIEVDKVQDIVEATCKGNETQQVVAEKLALEIEKVLKIGSLQIANWRVPNFPTTGAADYSMLKSQGCKVEDLFIHMKNHVDKLPPDLMNVYNLGLAIDTTESQGDNLRLLADNIDRIYSSLPANANIAFAVTAYGDEDRGGFKIEGNKSYVLSRVKQFIRNQKIHGGGTPPEFVYGGSHIVSKNLGRAHGLIFNWTNATGDNSKAHTASGRMIPYSLNDLKGFGQKNIHIIRNVFLRCR